MVGGLGSGKHEISKSGAVVGSSDDDSRQGHGRPRVFGDRAVLSARQDSRGMFVCLG